MKTKKAADLIRTRTIGSGKWINILIGWITKRGKGRTNGMQ